MSLTLTLLPIVKPEGAAQHCWRVAGSVVSDEDGLPDEVFVWQVSADEGVADVFQCVASVRQMSDIGLVPYGTVSGRQCPFYRKASFSVDARSPVEAEELQSDIRDDLQALLENHRAAQTLGEATEEVLS